MPLVVGHIANTPGWVGAGINYAYFKGRIMPGSSIKTPYVVGAHPYTRYLACVMRTGSRFRGVRKRGGKNRESENSLLQASGEVYAERKRPGICARPIPSI